MVSAGDPRRPTPFDRCAKRPSHDFDRPRGNVIKNFGKNFNSRIPVKARLSKTGPPRLQSYKLTFGGVVTSYKMTGAPVVRQLVGASGAPVITVLGQKLAHQNVVRQFYTLVTPNSHTTRAQHFDGEQKAKHSVVREFF